MTQDETIQKGNKLIAEYMGYIFYHPHIDIDTSDCGGIYERFEIFSKTPIVVEEFPKDDQYYFGDIPHPEKEGEVVCWSFCNNFETELNYHKNWNDLMPVVKKCCEDISQRPGVDARGSWNPISGYVDKIFTMSLNSSIDTVWNAVVSSILKTNKLKNEISN